MTSRLPFWAILKGAGILCALLSQFVSASAGSDHPSPLCLWARGQLPLAIYSWRVADPASGECCYSPAAPGPGLEKQGKRGTRSLSLPGSLGGLRSCRWGQAGAFDKTPMREGSGTLATVDILQYPAAAPASSGSLTAIPTLGPHLSPSKT